MSLPIQISLKAVAIIFFFQNQFMFIFYFFQAGKLPNCLSRRLNLSPEMRLISNIPEWFKWFFF